MFAPPEPDDAIGVFVAPRGDAANPGTRAAPLANIAEAAKLAKQTQKVVFVAAGTYREEVRTSVSLYGGYSPDFRQNDPDRFETKIIATGDGDGSRALHIHSGELAVYGFTVRGGESVHTSAVSIEATARPTLIRCVVHGGGREEMTGLTMSSGISAHAEAVYTLRDSTVHGGANQHCRGIQGASKGCVIERNTISGGGSGTSSITEAIHASGGFTLTNNTIDAGTGTKWTRGVTLYGSRATVTGNRITTPRGDWHDCLSPGTGSFHVIHGNTLDGIPDEECFAWANKLEPRTWRFNAQDGEWWCWQDVELVPRGLLAFTSDSAEYQARENSYGIQYGPTLTFREFLRDGPPAHENMDAALAAEIRAVITGSGCTLEAIARLDTLAHRDVLLRAVIAHPELDEPRYAYADYLESSGDPTGEYIRLLTWYQNPNNSYDPVRLKRIGELKDLEASIAAPLAPWIKNHILSRGLVAHVTMDARTFIDAGREVLSRAPIVHLRLQNTKAVFAELVACPLLARVKTLEIGYDELEDAEVLLLAASPHVRQLEYLDLANNNIDEAGLEAIAASPNFANLRALWIMANPCGDPVDREGMDISDEPYWQPAVPFQKVLIARYGRKVWMDGKTSPSLFDIGCPQRT